MTVDKKLDLNLLHVAAALLDAGSATDAATKLGISQPSVSVALGKLRAHFGESLFVRTPEGMSPTPRGAEVALAARQILQLVDEKLLPNVLFDPTRRHKSFTLAMSDVGAIVFLPKILNRLRTASPETSVVSVGLSPALLARALESGDVDLAIGYFPDLKSGDFFQQRLFQHHFVCLLRHDHPVRGERLTMGDFLALQHVVVRSEGRSQEILESYLESHGLTRRVALYTPHFMGLRRVLANSDLVATVPHALGFEYSKEGLGVKAMGTPFPSPRIELRQHWHRKVHKDARNMWLRSLVSELFNKDTDEW